LLWLQCDVATEVVVRAEVYQSTKVPLGL
jgi:hypothetical protein